MNLYEWSREYLLAVADGEGANPHDARVDAWAEQEADGLAMFLQRAVSAYMDNEAEPLPSNERIESPSGYSFRESQENGDGLDCAACGNALDDDFPILNDDEGYAYHPGCRP